MLFKFLKYTNPINYFNLTRKDGCTVFPSWENVPEEFKINIELDHQFSNERIAQIDASWQLVKKGFIGSVKTVDFQKDIPLIDEYRFIRKYFHKFWVSYVLVLRMITFNNPIKEIRGYLNSNTMSRTNVHSNPIKYAAWKSFKSKLLETEPKVSVIIPTLNRYEYLKDVLSDLEQQDYTNFDVMIVDQSLPFQKEFYETYKLDIKLIHQQEKALWQARNTAIKTSNADYFLLFDDDSRVEKNWITMHLKGLNFFKADISSGTSISKVGAKIPESYGYFKLSDQIDTGNVLINKKVFKEIGLFDRQFEKQRMGDGEFGLRAYLNGFLNVSNPYASRLHLKVGTGGLRQMGSWDGMRPVNWFAPRPIPSVIYLFRKYFGNNLTLFALLKAVPPSLIPYKYKGNNKMLMLGFLVAVLLFPLVLFQVGKSWRLASIKLKQGPIIETL